MASRTGYPVADVYQLPGATIIAGTFTVKTGGLNAGDITNIVGRGFSVVEDSTGVYTVTINESFKRLVSIQVTVLDSFVGESHGILYAHVDSGSVDLSDLFSSFQIKVFTVTDTEETATRPEGISFFCLAANTSIVKEHT